MRKNFCILTILLILILLSGCSKNILSNHNKSSTASPAVASKTTNLKTNINLSEFKNSLTIVEEDIYNTSVDITSYLDKENDQPFGFFDSKYILVYSFVSNDFAKVSIEDGSRESVYSLSNGQRAITYRYDDNVIVWVEDGETESDGIIGEKWGIYAFNLLTKKIQTIETEDEKTTPADRIFCATPNAMTYNDGFVVYDARQYYKGNLCEVLKLYKMNTCELLIIDTLPFKLNETNNTWFGIPSSNKNYLAYSISKANLEELTEFGEIYLYNINENTKTHLITSDNLLHPVLCNDYFIARMKPDGHNENSEIWVYDIEANKWITSITNQSNLYENYIVKPFELIGLLSNDNYFTWHESTYAAAIGIADLNNSKLIPVVTKKRGKDVTIRMFNNGMLLWTEFGLNEERELSRYKYVILD